MLTRLDTAMQTRQRMTTTMVSYLSPRTKQPTQHHLKVAGLNMKLVKSHFLVFVAEFVKQFNSISQPHIIRWTTTYR